MKSTFRKQHRIDDLLFVLANDTHFVLTYNESPYFTIVQPI